VNTWVVTVHISRLRAEIWVGQETSSEQILLLLLLLLPLINIIIIIGSSILLISTIRPAIFQN
jgi:hypothetical protein